MEGQQVSPSAARGIPPAGSPPEPLSSMWLQEVFTYHETRPDQLKAYTAIRGAAASAAKAVVQYGPSVADKDADSRIAKAIHELENTIDEHVPNCEDRGRALELCVIAYQDAHDRSVAINHIRCAVMWANAGVALNGLI